MTSWKTKRTNWRASRSSRRAALALASTLAVLAPSAQTARAAPAGELGPVRYAPRLASAAGGPGVRTVLAQMIRRRRITGDEYRADIGAYDRARHAFNGLSGTRAYELGAVIADAERIARDNELSASLAPSLFLTLERNAQWWSHDPLLGDGQRVSFAPSELIFEHYPGQGLQIQWLGTFGRGNGLIDDGHDGGALRRIVDEILALAADRAGGLSWDYLFPFDGGTPPWSGGLSQGTGLELLAHAGKILHSSATLAAARRALALFKVPPPAGVRIRTRAGAAYAEYTFAPGDRILNGFIQADVGLYEYARSTHSTVAARLFAEGDAQARVETPRYNTGYWSLYDQYGESTLNYQIVLAEFLRHLCRLTREGPPGAPRTLADGASTTPRPIAADDIYCRTATDFFADLHTPPRLRVLTARAADGRPGAITVSVSKISSVTLSVHHGARVLFSTSLLLSGGRHRLWWQAPRRPGRYTVDLAATDLAGNHARISTPLVLSRR